MSDAKSDPASLSGEVAGLLSKRLAFLEAERDRLRERLDGVLAHTDRLTETNRELRAENMVLTTLLEEQGRLNDRTVQAVRRMQDLNERLHEKLEQLRPQEAP
jgi:hypothetical protein